MYMYSILEILDLFDLLTTWNFVWTLINQSPPNRPAETSFLQYVTNRVPSDAIISNFSLAENIRVPTST